MTELDRAIWDLSRIQRDLEETSEWHLCMTNKDVYELTTMSEKIEDIIRNLQRDIDDFRK